MQVLSLQNVINPPIPMINRYCTFRVAGPMLIILLTMGSEVRGREPQMMRTTFLSAMEAPSVLIVTVTFHGEFLKASIP